MPDFWSKVFFWLSFGLISSLVLRYFYFSKNATLLRRLRLAAAVFIIAVFALLFFPWLPEGRGGPTGWGAIFQGNAPMVILAGLLGFTLVTLFMPGRPLLSKIGVIAHLAAIIFLFGLMIYTYPVTVSLKFRDTAPIFAFLIMLINNVVLLALWHQLQINKKV